MAKVESFTLDHTAVKAPYVRLITVEEGPKGDKISNFDLRLVQPNENAIPTAGLHTIEHMLAGYLRDHMEDVQGTDIKSCGNYRDHSLFSAQEWCKKILEEGISSDPFVRKVID